MAEKGKYYMFSPPFSKSEHFVKVIGVRGDGSDGKRYVYYKHMLGGDIEDNCEEEHFNKGSTQLTEERVSRIENNIQKEIKNLEEKRQDFLKVLEKIRNEGRRNGTKEDEENTRKREIERVDN